MNIAFITTNDWVPFGGSEVLWYKAALRMLGDGFKVGVGIKNWPEMPFHIAELKQNGADLLFKSTYFENPSKVKRVFNRFVPAKLQYKGKLHEQYEILDSYRPDYVVLSLGHQNEPFEWARECKKRNIPYSLIIQLVMDAHVGSDGEMFDIISECYTGAEKVFFVSRNNKELLEKLLATKLNNSEVIFNPFQVPFDVSLPFPDYQGMYKLASVASYSAYHKAPQYIFEVLAEKVWQERPLEVNLYGKGHNEVYLKRLKDYYGLKNVNFKGHSNDVKQIWAENHGLIMSSRMEGMPLALIEAMLCGRVSVVPDIGGNTEIVDNDINGFIAKYYFPEFIHEALDRAWVRRGEWESMGKNAQEKIKSVLPADPAAAFVEKLKAIL